MRTWEVRPCVHCRLAFSASSLLAAVPQGTISNVVPTALLWEIQRTSSAEPRLTLLVRRRTL
jgi:hypothetical protein